MNIENPKPGMRVEVFNTIGDNFDAIVVRVNKQSVGVRAVDKNPPFNNHREVEGKTGYEYIVKNEGNFLREPKTL